MIERDNTLTNPHFTDVSGRLKRFDFAVANPPFSDKAWTNGLNPANDEYRRFEYGEASGQERGLRLSAPPPRVPQEHRQGCDHHAARGPLPG